MRLLRGARATAPTGCAWEVRELKTARLSARDFSGARAQHQRVWERAAGHPGRQRVSVVARTAGKAAHIEPLRHRLFGEGGQGQHHGPCSLLYEGSSTPETETRLRRCTDQASLVGRTRPKHPPNSECEDCAGSGERQERRDGGHWLVKWTGVSDPACLAIYARTVKVAPSGGPSGCLIRLRRSDCSITQFDIERPGLDRTSAGETAFALTVNRPKGHIHVRVTSDKRVDLRVLAVKTATS